MNEGAVEFYSLLHWFDRLLTEYRALVESRNQGESSDDAFPIDEDVEMLHLKPMPLSLVNTAKSTIGMGQAIKINFWKPTKLCVVRIEAI